MTGFYVRYIYLASKAGDYICVENVYLPNLITIADPTRLGFHSKAHGILNKKNILNGPDLSDLKTEWCYSRYCKFDYYHRKHKSYAYISELIAGVGDDQPSVGGWIRSADDSLDIKGFLKGFSVASQRIQKTNITVVETEMINIDNIWKPQELILLQDIT